VVFLKVVDCKAAGQRPAVNERSHNCLKGRTFAPFCPASTGRCEVLCLSAGR